MNLKLEILFFVSLLGAFNSFLLSLFFIKKKNISAYFFGLLLFCLGGVTAWSSSRLFDTSARWWHPPRSSSSAVSLFSLTTSRIKSSRSLGTTPSEESPHLAASIATTATDVTAAPSPVDPFRAPSSRRSLLRHGFGGALLGQVLTTTALLPQQAQARGLVQFPCPHLSNTYHFLRVGQTLLEAQDMWSTNPLFLTVCVCMCALCM